MLHEADRVVEQHFVVGHVDTDRRELGSVTRGRVKYSSGLGGGAARKNRIEVRQRMPLDLPVRFFPRAQLVDGAHLPRNPGGLGWELSRSPGSLLPLH